MHSYDRCKKSMEVQGYCRRKNRARWQQWRALLPEWYMEAWRFYPRKSKNRYTYPTPSKSASKTLVFRALLRGKSVTPAAWIFRYSWHLILAENRIRKERCNAFDPENREKGKNILPTWKSPRKVLVFPGLLDPKSLQPSPKFSA